MFNNQEAADGRVRSRRAAARFRRGRALPGAAGQRHAGAAQAHAAAGRAAGPGLPCGAGDRRADVGCVGQGAGGHPRHAGVPGRRAACAGAHRRHHPARWRQRLAAGPVADAVWQARRPRSRT